MWVCWCVSGDAHRAIVFVPVSSSVCLLTLFCNFRRIRHLCSPNLCSKVSTGKGACGFLRGESRYSSQLAPPLSGGQWRSEGDGSDVGEGGRVVVVVVVVVVVDWWWWWWSGGGGGGEGLVSGR